MTTCATCGRAFPANELQQTQQGLLCAECRVGVPGATPTGSKLPLTAPGFIGLVAGVAPFFMNFTTSSSMTLNGEVTQSTYRDYVALGGAGIAAVFGVIALLGALKATDQRGLRIGICAGIIGLALLQVVRGFGLV